MKKIKVKGEEYNLEDKDAALITLLLEFKRILENMGVINK